ncbi:MAG: helix-turn-helix domain-containing protein [Bacteroidota bacterium]
MKGIGTKIRKIRELKNYTQEYMAQQLGIAQNSYSRYENPDTDVKPDLLAQIADILEVSPEQIEGFDEKQIFNNHGTMESQSGAVGLYQVNHYAIDPKIEKLYEDQIALLKKQNELLEAKIAELNGK